MENSKFQNKFQQLLYKRGYIITEKTITPPHAHWEHIQVFNYHFYYDPINEVFFQKNNNNWVLLLGNIIDIRSYSMDKSLISNEILNSLDQSLLDFYNYLDDLSGRYIVFYGDYNGNTSILSDATGLRSIFYSTSETVISSHAELIREIIQAKESPLVENEWLSKYVSSQLPGHYTPYEDIYFLTPNTLLNVPKKEVIRFFPRENLNILSMDTIVKEISTISKKQMELLKQKNNQFLFSLTAGVDSRTSLALTKDFIDSFIFFTYIKENSTSTNLSSYTIDEKIATDISDNLKLNHKLLTIDYNIKNEEFQDFCKILKKNTFTQHNFRLAKLYYDEFPENILHIRSNVFEIGRMFYRKNHKLPKDITIDSIIKCYSPKALGDKKVEELFMNYYKHVQMDKIYNYDPFDILYWEYRMGTWISQVITESDIAHDTFILFNVRKILKLLLSVSHYDKQENTVFKEIINENWPILNYWEINGLGNPVSHYDKQFDEVGLPLKNTQFASGSLTDSSRDVPMQKKVQTRRFKFFMEASNPREGDFAQAEISLKTELNQGYQCIIQLRSPYENKKTKGRLKYQVILNETPLLEEDISLWGENNQISISWQSKKARNQLKIRVFAQRDCEDWSWGKAGTILVEKVSLRKEDQIGNNISLNFTSPFSSTLIN